VLYPRLQEARLGPVIGEGPRCATVRIELQPFRAGLARQRAWGLLDTRCANRFGNSYAFAVLYRGRVVHHRGPQRRKLGPPADEAAARLPNAPRGTPRIGAGCCAAVVILRCRRGGWSRDPRNMARYGADASGGRISWGWTAADRRYLRPASRKINQARTGRMKTKCRQRCLNRATALGRA